jgi:integrase
VGTYGEINTKLRSGRWDSRALFRDYDGVTRQVRATGPTKAAAEKTLKERLRDRQTPSGTVIKPDSKVTALADAFIRHVEASNRATGTKQQYAGNVERYVKPALGGLYLREATTGRVDDALAVIRDKHGPGAAKSTRSVLSGMFKLAVRHDAVKVNPVREVETISVRRNRARALTAEQTTYVCDYARSSEFAISHDLPDLLDWMLATGCRIGEACAARPGVNSEGEQLLDLDAGTWEINATVVRVRGKGLIVQEWTKSDAGWRVVALPPFTVAMVRRRQSEVRLPGPYCVVFPAPAAKSLRDPSNTPGDMRTFFDAIDCEACEHTGWQHDDHGNILRDKHRQPVRCRKGPYSWVTSHTCRKTVATRLEEAGWTARQVADQLGHSQPSMTQDVYFGRGVVNKQAAVVLDR